MARQSLGKGTVWLMFSVFISVLSNYILHIGIARLAGPETYGLFGVLISLYLVNDAVLNVGIPRALSKFISESPHQAGKIITGSFRMQFILALLFSAAFMFLSKPLALLLGDETLIPYLLLLGIMIVPFSLTSFWLSGCLNGLSLFREQAIIKTIFPLSRTALAFLFLSLGFGLLGVLAAFFLSIILAGGMSYYYLHRQTLRGSAVSGAAGGTVMGRAAADDTAKVLRFAFPLMIAVLAMALLRNVNTLFIKYFLQDNAAVAWYTAAFTLSNVSYLVFTALPLALTPSISRASAENNVKLVRKYISSSLRYALLLLLPLSLLVAATADTLVPLLYSSSYAGAAPLLRILIFSSTFLALFSILTSIITAGGKPKMELAFSALFVFLLVLFNVFLIPRYGLMGAAYGQAVTAFMAMLAAGMYIYTRFAVLLPWQSVLRLGGISLIIFLLASTWSYPGIFILINYAALAALYFLLLFLFGEITAEDWSFLQKLFRRAPADPSGGSA